MGRAAIGMLLATGFLAACFSARGEGTSTSGGTGSSSAGATTTGGGNSGGGTTTAAGTSSGGATAAGSSAGSSGGSGSGSSSGGSSGGGNSSGGSGGSTSSGTTTGGNDGGIGDGGCPLCGGVCCTTDQTCVATACCDTAKACGMACCTDTTDCQSPSSGAQLCSDRCDNATTCGPATPCCEVLNPSGADAGGHCLPYDCGNECCPDTITKCDAYCQHLLDCLDAGLMLDCNSVCGGAVPDAGAFCPDLGLAFDCLTALSCDDLNSQGQAFTDCTNKANCPDAG